jgi:hypothetical protein
MVSDMHPAYRSTAKLVRIPNFVRECVGNYGDV